MVRMMKAGLAILALGVASAVAGASAGAGQHETTRPHEARGYEARQDDARGHGEDPCSPENFTDRCMKHRGARRCIKKGMGNWYYG
jgi:hypothetical protein